MISFSQFEFNIQERFEPSTSVKEFWQYTHKTKENFAGVELPGLFQTTGYATQIGLFLLTLILEGVATYFSFQDGVDITAIVLMIVIDIGLAIIAHRWHKDICRYRNERIVARSREEQERFNRAINTGLFWTNFFYFLIACSGAFKFYWFYSVYYLFDTKALFILACYGIGALLHMFFTGYAFFTSMFNFRIQREYSQYIRDKKHTVNAVFRQPIETTVELAPVRVGNHEIIRESDGKFYFTTLGILLDRELRDMISFQSTSEQKGIIAREGLRHQLRILKR